MINKRQFGIFHPPEFIAGNTGGSIGSGVSLFSHLPEEMAD
jgi:hypothetical protein